MEDKIDVDGLAKRLYKAANKTPTKDDAVMREAATALTALQAENERLRGEVETLQGAQIVNRNAIRMQRAARERAEAERDAWKANAEGLAASLKAADLFPDQWTGRDSALAAHAKLKGDV